MIIDSGTPTIAKRLEVEWNIIKEKLEEKDATGRAGLYLNQGSSDVSVNTHV